MSYIAVDQITFAYERMKHLLFPIRWKLWVKLAFLMILATSFSFPSLRGYSRVASLDTQLVNVLILQDQILTFWQSYSFFIISGLILSFLLGILWLYISSRFTFVLLHSLDKNRIQVRNSLANTRIQGNSYFCFQFFFSLLSLVLFVALAIPMGILFFSSSSFEFFSYLPYLIPLGFFVVFCILLNLFLKSFVIYYMYERKKKTLHSFSKIFSLFRNDWREFLLYLVLGFLVGMVIGIVFLFIAFVIAVPAILVVLGGYFLLPYLYSSYGLLSAVLVAIPLVLIFLFSVFVAFLALLVAPETFSRYYSLLFMRTLLKTSKSV